MFSYKTVKGWAVWVPEYSNYDFVGWKMPWDWEYPQWAEQESPAGNAGELWECCTGTGGFKETGEGEGLRSKKGKTSEANKVPEAEGEAAMGTHFSKQVQWQNIDKIMWIRSSFSYSKCCSNTEEHVQKWSQNRNIQSTNLMLSVKCSAFNQQSSFTLHLPWHESHLVISKC